MKKLLVIIVLLPLFSLYANEPAYETNVTFRGFSWGTGMDEFIRRMGNPVSREEVNGFTSLLWQNIEVNGYMTYMLAYFTSAGLQGGTYYFLTREGDLNDLMRCYTAVQRDLRNRYGPTRIFSGIVRELRVYDSFWNLDGGSVHLKANTRDGDPVTLWYCSPEMARQLYNRLPSTTGG